MAGRRYIWQDDTPSTSEAVVGSAEVAIKQKTGLDVGSGSLNDFRSFRTNL